MSILVQRHRNGKWEDIAPALTFDDKLLAHLVIEIIKQSNVGGDFGGFPYRIIEENE